MHRLIASAGFFLTATMVISAAMASTCTTKLVESFALTRLNSGRYTLQALIHNQPVHLMIDTGASNGVLTDTIADSLGLTRQGFHNTNNSSAYGGTAFREYVIADDVVIGHLKADSMKFFLLPRAREETDGLLGVDVLSRFDVELDFPHLRMALYEHSVCGAQAVTWTSGAVATIPFRIEKTHVKFDAVLDGKQVAAELDSGMVRNAFSLETTKVSYSLNETGPDMRRLGSPDNPHPSYLHTFQSLGIGTETVANPQVTLVPDDVAKLSVDEPRLLVGVGTLSELHLFIAFGEQKLYVTSGEAH
jgi:clan AA aspartic protease (TIGR02281 family)